MSDFDPSPVTAWRIRPAWRDRLTAIRQATYTAILATFTAPAPAAEVEYVGATETWGTELAAVPVKPLDDEDTVDLAADEQDNDGADDVEPRGRHAPELITPVDRAHGLTPAAVQRVYSVDEFLPAGPDAATGPLDRRRVWSKPVPPELATYPAWLATQTAPKGDSR